MWRDGRPGKNVTRVPASCEAVDECIEGDELKLQDHTAFADRVVRVRVKPGPELELDYRLRKVKRPEDKGSLAL